MRNLFDIKTIENLRDELERAVLTDRALPPTASLRAKSTWTDYMREADDLATIIKDAPPFNPNQEDIAKWEVVCLEWHKLCSSPQEWAVIWLKACRCPSKLIEKKTGMCRTKVWYVYEKGLRRLYEKLTAREIPQCKMVKKQRLCGYTADLISIKKSIEILEKKLKASKRN